MGILPRSGLCHRFFPRTFSKEIIMQRTVFSRTALAAALLALGASAPFAYAAGTTGSSSDKAATNTGSSKAASSSELKSTDKKFIEEAARGTTTSS